MQYIISQLPYGRKRCLVDIYIYIDKYIYIYIYVYPARLLRASFLLKAEIQLLNYS